MKCRICKEELIPEKDKVLQLSKGHITSGEYQDFISGKDIDCYVHSDCFDKIDFPQEKKGPVFTTGWEDGECCSVTELTCSCGTNLLEGYDKSDYTASHEETTECPKCGSKYQFIWVGMTIKRI